MKTETLKRELFKNEVIFKGDLAKWENYKHPDNPEFSQPVYWVAWKSNDHITVAYFLSSNYSEGRKLHARTPMNGKSFEDSVYEYWSNN